MGSKLRVAVVQSDYPSKNCGENTEIGLEFVRKAKQMEADIVLFPECWINGYEIPVIGEGITMDNVLKIETFEKTFAEFKQTLQFQEWVSKVQSPDSEYVMKFRNLAKELSIGLVLTCYTKGKERPRNSAMVIDKNGEVLTIYSKVHTCEFSLERMIEGGDEFVVCDFEGVKLGIMICYDREYPESARVLMMKGAELILVPNCCSSMEPRVQALCTRAYENMVGVAMANVSGENCGMSCAFNPIPWDENGKTIDMKLLIADDVSEDVYIVEFDMDEIRHYRENEMMGNTFRQIKAYDELMNKEVKTPFIRDKWMFD